jgi:hypothetical protein
MLALFHKSIDQILADSWNQIYHASKAAFFIVFSINLLAYGFEMTNLTLHRDDVAQIFIQDHMLGHYLGRFGLGWLNYYWQNAYFMPFLQMMEAILLMSLYGILIARFWRAENAIDIALIASIVSVFPYLGQLHQYNTGMAPYSLAHLLAASAVILSTRATLFHASVAVLLYAGAFSIYQSVIANAAVIFSVWALVTLISEKSAEPLFTITFAKATFSAILSVVAGGILYLAIVSLLDIDFDYYQGAGEALSLKQHFNFVESIKTILEGSRKFFMWPENYFPDYLKKIQLAFITATLIICIWVPRGLLNKFTALLLLSLVIFSPRILQFIHPGGTYHNLTLTAYAVVIAGCVYIVNRAAHTFIRNISVIIAAFLITGYIMQCNWISTVNYLNTFAHYTTLTQVLARIRSLPGESWNGDKIMVFGNHLMMNDYPFKTAKGVATTHLDASRMQKLAWLMRENVSIEAVSENAPKALEFAQTHPVWPHPDSVGVVDGAGVVVFSNYRYNPDAHPENVNRWQ